MPLMRRVERLYVDLPLARPGSLNAFLFAALFVLVATLLRVALPPWIGGIYFITYFPTVIVVAILFGFAAGLFAVVLAAGLAWLFVIPPYGRLVFGRTEDLVALTLFLLVATAIVLLVGALRVAIGRFRDLNRALQAHVERRTEELQTTQAHLAQAQKMEALGQLTGGIAHDFNNMLAVVLGNLDLAQRRLAAGRTDVSRHVGNAAEGAARAAALTQRLLAFSRRQPLAPAVTDTGRMLSDLVELLRRTLGESIRVEHRAADGLWPVCVDPGQMESAIVNLAVNARDAMPDGGRLRIEAENRLVGEEEAALRPLLETGDYIVLAVADDGCGMPAEVAERAIEPFFTTKEVGRGTGLGLSQVYGFLRQSGGDLAIESVEGEGTTVRLYLPRHTGDGPSKKEQGPTSGPPRGRTDEVILVVEDEDQVRRTTVEALVELGYGVREARGGLEALAILANDPSIDLLLTDVVMPGLDGRQLAARALRQRPDLKLLYVSGYTREGFASGESGPEAALLPKPFSIDQLARAVRTGLDADPAG